MPNKKPKTPPMPSVHRIGNGMDHRVTIERYIVCDDAPDMQECAGLAAFDLDHAPVTFEEAAERAEPQVLTRGFKGHIETPEWIMWEGEDGALHVANGRDELTGAVLGEVVKIERSK